MNTTARVDSVTRDSKLRVTTVPRRACLKFPNLDTKPSHISMICKGKGHLDRRGGCARLRAPSPLSSEYGTYKAVKARFRPWRYGEGLVFTFILLNARLESNNEDEKKVLKTYLTAPSWLRTGWTLIVEEVVRDRERRDSHARLARLQHLYGSHYPLE